VKIFSTDGSILMEVKAFERSGNNLEFRGTIMGSMPIKGRLTPAEARQALRSFRNPSWWWFFLTFLLR
jgi:hypothetical protein